MPPSLLTEDFRSFALTGSFQLLAQAPPAGSVAGRRSVCVGAGCRAARRIVLEAVGGAIETISKGRCRVVAIGGPLLGHEHAALRVGRALGADGHAVGVIFGGERFGALEQIEKAGTGGFSRQEQQRDGRQMLHFLAPLLLVITRALAKDQIGICRLPDIFGSQAARVVNAGREMAR